MTQKRTPITLFLFLYLGLVNLPAQQTAANMQTVDTVHVRAGSILWIADSSFYILKDTTLILSAKKPYRIESNVDIQSVDFYRSLRSRANKNIITRTLGDLVLVSRLKNGSAGDSLDFQRSVKYFMPYSGKRILHIDFKQVDVLSGSVQDTTIASPSVVSDALNALHTKTKTNVIVNNLLFQEGDTLRPDDLADSERILRTLPSIEDARIQVFLNSPDTSAVNILVVTKDVFSWGLGIRVISPDKYRFKVANRNLFGRGAELKYSAFYNRATDPPVAHELRYFVYNIQGSFISGLFNYLYSEPEQEIRLTFNRSLVSPQIEYIGSMDLSKTRRMIVIDQNGKRNSTHLGLTNQDFWIGRAFMLGKYTDRRNLIISTRVSRTRFTERPSLNETAQNFYNRTLILSRLSLVDFSYFKSRMIYSFGRTEDVPYGYVLQFTSGYEFGEFVDRSYLGVDLSWANSLGNLGYLGIAAELGSYLSSKKFTEGLLGLHVLFFSHLAELGNFRIRQIVRINYTDGINRPSDQTINLKDKLQGFTSREPVGRRNLVLDIENVTFTPWYFYGFRLAFFSYANLALISNKPTFVSPANFYATIGLGCRIKNESLIFETINFRLGYFIRAPQNLGVWDFEIQNNDPEIAQGLLGLKPAVTEYK